MILKINILIQNIMMLLIRNMGSDRCRTIVGKELKKLGLCYKRIELGEVELCGPISDDKLQLIADNLKGSGLELMISNKIIIISKIKEAIRQLIHSSNNLKRPNLSEYISREINYDYTYLSKIFSEEEGITIEKYFIKQRIECVKEMLCIGGLSLSDIAYKMLFSSVAHLSNQFKKVTGLTPYNFKQHWNQQHNNAQVM